MGAGWFILLFWPPLRHARAAVRVIVTGYALTLVLLMPLFWVIGSQANPGLAQAVARAPMVVSGPQCDYDPFPPSSRAGRRRPAARLLDHLLGKGVAYKLHQGGALAVTIGTVPSATDNDAAMPRSRQPNRT